MNITLHIIEQIIQYVVISSFIILTILGGLQRNWNYGVGLNFGLVLLYVFLYLQPIK